MKIIRTFLRKLCAKVYALEYRAAFWRGSHQERELSKGDREAMVRGILTAKGLVEALRAHHPPHEVGEGASFELKSCQTCEAMRLFDIALLNSGLV